MRDIRFKAKTIERYSEDGWMEGNYSIHYGAGGEFMFHELINSKQDYVIDPDTLCEYTGVVDIEDREVWEHDIVERLGKGNVMHRHPIRFSNGAFQAIAPDGTGVYVQFLKIWKYRICGNEIDNPEMLTK